MAGARIVLECLKRQGVDLIFGLPGGAVLPIYDALYDFEGLRHILVRQEAAAGHAAEGYARTSGRVGVCLVTSGPAATNLVTALQDALMDSIPIVAFTGQVPTHLIGNDAFQEADNVGITRPCTKHNFLVKDGNDLGPIIREAFHIASTGRPGPVHVDLPKDILVKEWDLVWPEHVQMRSYNPNYDGHPGQIKRAAKLLARAKKPVLYVGVGVISADASAELMELAELGQLPVTQTLMGLGSFPMEHPLSLDMLGMHGSYYANMAVHHSDVLVAVGARFDDRVTGKVDAFAPNAEIVHIDIDPSSISKNIKVGVPIVGDCRRVLVKLVEALREELKDEPPPAVREGRRQWAARQDRDHQQQRPRHGPPVAADHLQGALLRDRPAGDSRLGPPGRSLRLRRPARDQAERAPRGHREDDRDTRAGHPRRVRRQGRVRVPDGARRWGQHRHDPGAAHPRGAGPSHQVADGLLMQNGSEPRKHTISDLVENKSGRPT